MMASSRRTISSFSLSFLDIMFCGFGAVVLLVLIINSNTIRSRQERVAEYRSEFRQKDLEHTVAREHYQQLRNNHEALGKEIDDLQKQREKLVGQIAAITVHVIPESQLQDSDREIVRLQAELKDMDTVSRQLIEKQALELESGRRVRHFEGEGNRQYLTGLKLGGKRVLILIDSSSSMLDSTIVDVIRRKVLDEPARRTAPKWLKAVSTVEWIIANLPVESTIQVYHFSEETTVLPAEEKPSWLAVTDTPRIDELLVSLGQIAPVGGTNLEGAFFTARNLKPDNIILITDGLPTRSREKARSRTIDGAGRLKLFQRAIRQLPPAVPVNIVLFPMEGDPLAPVNFWQLAISSNGSFFTPTRDWP